jgi:hypothetical protein
VECGCVDRGEVGVWEDGSGSGGKTALRKEGSEWTGRLTGLMLEYDLGGYGPRALWFTIGTIYDRYDL